MENTRGQGTLGKERSNDSQQGRNQQTSGQPRTGNLEQQNASASRGRTTDMGSERSSNLNLSRSRGSSGITTKKNVTGSDYDGQVSEE